MERALLAAGCSLVLLAGLPAAADEGMWTFDNFPADAVERAYGFRPSPEWLARVRLGAARLAGGCSASFVSPDGLLMTNHHCADDCIAQLSTAKRDYVAAGFGARELADEVRCPEIEVNQLVEVTDVTERVAGALAGREGEAFKSAQRAEKARIEQECGAAADVRCDVVTLYQGGRYHLYRYRRFQDVRLVFAPESSIAFFGGDPDNFNFPRWDLDVTLLRVWDGDRPARTPDYFRWSPAGAREGDLVFVAGNPATTARLETVAQLEYERDYRLPERLLYLAELRGMLREFGRRGTEQARISSGLLYGTENSYKALRGQLAALVDPALLTAKRAAEAELRSHVAADAERRARCGGAWDAIAAAIDEQRRLRTRVSMIEDGRGFSSRLFEHARALVRLADESRLPDGERLEEYTAARLPELRQELLSPAPIHAELEIATLAFSLEKLREELGPDDAFVRKVLGVESPRELAAKLVAGSRLADPAVRRRLLEGGKPAVDGADDALIRLARLVDADARAVRKRHEDAVEAVLERNGELLARARFEILGTSVYPDATFTLRLTYGAVAGWTEPDGRRVAPFTRIGGAFERHTGSAPFALPRSWLEAKERLDLDLPFNFVTTNDIIGGNSGSPVLDREARIVGLVFDGNIHSLGGDYWFDAEKNRTVAVDSRALLEALGKVYGARRIVDEIEAGMQRPR